MDNYKWASKAMYNKLIGDGWGDNLNASGGTKLIEEGKIYARNLKEEGAVKNLNDEQMITSERLDDGRYKAGPFKIQISESASEVTLKVKIKNGNKNKLYDVNTNNIRMGDYNREKVYYDIPNNTEFYIYSDQAINSLKISYKQDVLGTKMWFMKNILYKDHQRLVYRKNFKTRESMNIDIGVTKTYAIKILKIDKDEGKPIGGDKIWAEFKISDSDSNDKKFIRILKDNQYVKYVKGIVDLSESNITIAMVDKSDNATIFKTDTDGYAGLTMLKPEYYGSYYFWETKVPEGYEAEKGPTKVKTYNTNSDDDNEKIIYNTPKKGTIQIIKKDKADNRRLAGAKFQIKNSDGQIIMFGTLNDYNGVYEEGKDINNSYVITDSKGQCTLIDMPFGKYKIEEINAPPGYDNSNEKKDVEIKLSDPSKSIEFLNKRTNITNWIIRKYDKDTEEPLSDAKFKIAKYDIVSYNTQNVYTGQFNIVNHVTQYKCYDGNNAVFYLEAAQNGQYNLEEKYFWAGDESCNINDKSVCKIHVNRDGVTGWSHFILTEQKTTIQVPVWGWKFLSAINNSGCEWNADENNALIVSTNNDGYVGLANLKTDTGTNEYGVKYGIYAIIESTAPQGYIIDYQNQETENFAIFNGNIITGNSLSTKATINGNDKYTQIVLYNQATTYTTYKNSLYGNLKIIKQNQDGTRLKGVKFKIQNQSTGDWVRDDKGNELVVETDDNGEAFIQGLPTPGGSCSYKVVEQEEGLPNGIIWSFQVDSEKNKIVDVVGRASKDEYDEVLITNIETEDLTLVKKGKNGNLSDVSFVIKNFDNTYLKIDGVNEARGNVTIESYASIKSVYHSNDATVFKTGDDGTVKIENILPGKYNVIELQNNHYGYKHNNKQEVSIEVVLDKENIIEIQNTQILGNLEIEKVDSRRPDIKLEDIEFKIGIKDGSSTKYLKITNMASIKGSVTIDENNNSGSTHVEYVDDKQSATTFITDSNGKIFVNNLEVYYDRDAKYEYIIEEYRIGDKLSPYYDVKNDVDRVTLEPNTTAGTKKVIQNIQLYVDLEGYVWEDTISGKVSSKNDIYDNGEYRVPNIPVFLKKNGVVIAERLTDSNGTYFFPAKGTYYSNATGNEYKIVIEELSQYVVEFEYNGLKYQSVNKNFSDNGSKASEIPSLREGINNDFSTIKGQSTKNNGTTQGQTGTGVGLTYTADGNYKSKLVQNTSYRADTVNGSVSPADRARILANTQEAGYSIPWSAGIRTVKNINLGIYQREQPDLAIVTDIEKIDLEINGYKHTYNYKQRGQYVNSGVPDTVVNPGYDAVMDGFSVDVKNNYTGNYKQLTYTRGIYDSYIAYTKSDQNNENRLKMFVTYKIVLKNEASEIISKAQSLRNYTDTRYKDAYSYIEGSQTQVVWNNIGVENGHAIWQAENIGNDEYISPGECMTIYLRYEVTTDTIVAMANLKDNEEIAISSTVTEITSYSTKKDGNIYGGIDKDSAPQNIKYGDVATYEDDTDSAPDLKIKRKSSKVISGLVFEDKTDSKLNSNNERIGNGIYNNGEDTVENVDVKILKHGYEKIIKLYNLDSSGNVVVKDAQFVTEGDGKYSFTGMVPGEYFIEYTYGRYDGKQTKIKGTDVTTQSYKSTIVDKNVFETLISDIDNEPKKYYEEIKNNGLWYWYRSSENFNKSSAVDKLALRNTINDNLEKIDYKVKSDYDLGKSNADNYIMKANTGIMDFAIEDTRSQSTDFTYVEGSREYQIKFGIVERPRQSVQVNKEISNICITLANGQILAQGDPRKESINYVTYPEGGTLKIEVDNEIIEGATLDIEYEITVENKSENDYDNINYYRYGTDRINLVKIKLDSIVDYVDEKLSVTYDIGNETSDFAYYDGSQINDKWQLIRSPQEEKDQLAGIDIDPNVYSAIKTRSNIVVRDTNIEIKPGESTSINLKAKKLISNINNEDMVFDNYTELIKVSNPVGRFYGEMTDGKWTLRTPGNFNITDEDTRKITNESDNSNYNRKVRNAKLIIIPPTGESRIYYVIGISCLIILLGGIILIKKKVLD